jgi:1-acyl-sn-glycerol-3-phosphate acyltransferase
MGKSLNSSSSSTKRVSFVAFATVASLNQLNVSSFRLSRISAVKPMVSSIPTNSPIASRFTSDRSLLSSSKLFVAAASAASNASTEMTSLEDKDPATKSFNPGPTINLSKSGFTKMNLFGFYYGLVACILGIPWFIALSTLQLIYKIFPKFDTTRKIPIMVGNIYGYTLLFLTRCFPTVKGRENLASVLGKDEQKNPRACMFVANHCSWVDIPFLACGVIGMRNYKMVSKSELLKVPILSKSLTVAGHVVLDRTDRKSQLQTYKKGVAYLKNNVHLVTFAEGTRSRDGRLQPFKKGAFKMAQATGAPIIPVSISYAHLVNPVEFAWPMRSAMSVPAGVVIGKPIETKDKDDEQLLLEVRQAIIDNLPESQRPKPETPASA